MGTRWASEEEVVLHRPHELRQGALSHNRTPGVGWQIVKGFLPCEAALETASHETVVTLSDLEVYRFSLELVSLAPTAGGCFAVARYSLFDGPVAGATLEILSSDEVFYANGSAELIDVSTLELFEPDRVRLTTRDDRSFDLSLARGVERIEDHNGNHLVFQDGSIVHSSGKTLTVDRDTAGRITRITDPNGHQIAYGYDPQGDLVSVTDQVGSTTRFTYDDDHRILEIEDPQGNRAVRNDYDADGRWVRTTDALGGAIEFTHDLGNRRQATSFGRSTSGAARPSGPSTAATTRPARPFPRGVSWPWPTTALTTWPRLPIPWATRPSSPTTAAVRC